MLKHIADLSGNYEYFIGWAGQSTARPWGSKAEAYLLFPEYEAGATGIDLTGVVIVTGSGTETLTVSTTMDVDQWVGAYLRLGTTSSPLVGYALVIANAANSITVEWQKAATPGTVAGILTYEDYRFAYRPQVRILTPYQPALDSTTKKLVEYPDPAATVANGGRSLTMGPGFTTPTNLASFDHAAALLEFTFNEGIEAYGISEVSGGGACTGAAATTFNFTTATTAGYFVNGYLRVDWTDSGGDPKVSWSRIDDNTANQFTGLSWSGDGTPDFAGGTIDRWTAWVPHYANNPWSYSPGEGYDYPNNDMQPCAFSTNGSAIKNRPRGRTGTCYGDQFGDLLVVATRMSMATGKRINVVHLAVNAAGLSPINTLNAFGFDGIIGWYDHRDVGAWAPSLGSRGIFQRLDTLLRYCLPNAMEAEGNTKTPKFLAWFYSQGETDALNKGARLHYRESLRGLKAAIRNTIKGLGYSPYTNGAEVPWVQAKIMHVAYELKGTYPYYAGPFVFDGDGESLVNNAILEENAGDEFGEWIYTDDLPRKATDPNHLNGVGECARGARSSKRMAEMVDHALGYGSPCLTSEDHTVALYNRALSLIGEAPDIQNAEDGSEQLRLCQLFTNECRDTLLQMRQWSFALRRVALTEVKMPQQPLYTQWAHCYVLPPEALNAFRVLPPDAIEEPPTEAELISWANDPAGAYSTAFVAAWDEGLALNTSIDPATVDASTLPLVDEDGLEPQVFQVERSPHGGRYIFTNQEQATLQYVERCVDASEWSPSFSEAFCAYLASKLAGSLIKGKESERVAAGMLQKAAGYVRVASSSEGQQRKANHGPFDFVPDHLANR